MWHLELLFWSTCQNRKELTLIVCDVWRDPPHFVQEIVRIFAALAGVVPETPQIFCQQHPEKEAKRHRWVIVVTGLQSTFPTKSVAQIALCSELQLVITCKSSMPSFPTLSIFISQKQILHIDKWKRLSVGRWLLPSVSGFVRTALRAKRQCSSVVTKTFPFFWNPKELCCGPLCASFSFAWTENGQIVDFCGEAPRQPRPRLSANPTHVSRFPTNSCSIRDRSCGKVQK